MFAIEVVKEEELRRETGNIGGERYKLVKG